MGIFLIYLSVTFLTNLTPLYNGIRDMGYTLVKFGIVNPTLFETAYTDGFSGKNGYVTGNGALQKLVGARIVNERYKQDNGHLTYIIDEYDVGGIAEKTIAFREVLETMGIPFFYINTPFKVHRTDKQLPAGVEDYSNENADRYLAYLKKENIPVLDLRDAMEEDKLSHYDMYYKTDHHWKVEAGLWATNRISVFLAQQDAGFAVDNSIWDPSNYEHTLYEDVFLGSSGRRVGPLYIEREDFTLITPKFETNLTFCDKQAGTSREGSFRDVFLFMGNLVAEDPYKSNTYQVYCGANRGKIEISNYSAIENITIADKKILIIRDSYSDVVIPFLSLGYAQTHAIDLREFDGDLMEHIAFFEPDAVLIVYNPGAYKDNNEMFDFLQ